MVILSRPAFAAVPITRPNSTAGFSPGVCLAAATALAASSSSLPVCSPDAVAGTRPKFDSAE